MNKKLITTISIFVSIVLLLSGVFIIYTLRNPYGQGVSIRNLSNYTDLNSSNKDSIDIIKNNLYEQVSRNIYPSSYDKVKNISDAIVRNDSFTQEYNKDSKIYSVEFIVDIESVKQSYLVNYQWSDDSISNIESDIDQYGNLVSCLPVDQLIYDDFNCQDLGSDMRDDISPYIDIDWSSYSDQYGNSLSSQLLPTESQYIEEQIIGDYDNNNKLKRINNTASAKDVLREVNSGNYLLFIVDVNNTMYSVKITYDADRSIEIINNKSNTRSSSSSA